MREFVRTRKVISVILAYLLVGFAYVVGGYVESLLTARDVVFSPIVGIPLGAPFWPMMVYGDILHTGLMPRHAVLLVVMASIVALLWTSWMSR